VLERCFSEAAQLPVNDLLERRYQKFRKMAQFWIGE